jgi:hypothetical protein
MQEVQKRENVQCTCVQNKGSAIPTPPNNLSIILKAGVIRAIKLLQLATKSISTH